MDTARESSSIRKERYLLATFFLLPALASSALFWMGGALNGKYLLFSSFLAFSGVLVFALSLARIRTHPRGRWLYQHAPVVCFMLAIFWASSFPITMVETITTPPDYVMHTLEYVVFGFLVVRMLNPRRRRYRTLPHVTLPFLFCILYAALDEVHQYFVPGRQASLRDLACDAVGIAIGMWAYTLIMETAKGKRAAAKES